MLPLLRQRAIDALEIGGGLVHVGLLHFEIVEAGDRIDLDGARLGALAHHLLVHLAFGRHVDDDIAQELRLAGQPAAGDQAALVVVALLDGGECREMSRRVERMPCLANSPSPMVIWQRPQMARPPQTESMSTPSDARRLQHRRAERKPPALAGRREDDQGVGFVASVMASAHLVPRGAGPNRSAPAPAALLAGAAAGFGPRSSARHPIAWRLRMAGAWHRGICSSRTCNCGRCR